MKEMMFEDGIESVSIYTIRQDHTWQYRKYPNLHQQEQTESESFMIIINMS